MSVMSCSICDGYIDTDFDVEGVWPKVDNNDSTLPAFVCFSCVQDQTDDKILSWGYDPETLERLTT